MSFSLLPVYVCTLAEEVFHEGLGNGAEVDVCLATIATTLQRYFFCEIDLITCTVLKCLKAFY